MNHLALAVRLLLIIASYVMAFWLLLEGAWGGAVVFVALALAAVVMTITEAGEGK